VPSIYDLKKRFQDLLRPPCRALARRGVTANQVTLAAMALSFASGGLVLLWPGERWPLLVMPAALLARMALNAIDGMLAREHGMRSALGALLNELGDVLSDAALYLPLGVVPGLPARLIAPIVVLAIIVEMTGVVAAQIGAGRRYDGPMGKSDRAFAFGVVTLLLGAGVPPGTWSDIVLAAIAVLLGATIVNRARAALRGVAP